MCMKAPKVMKSSGGIRKKITKTEKKFTHVTPREHALMQQWREEGESVNDIAALTKRSTDTVSKHLYKKKRAKKPLGRPVAISEKDWPHVENTYNKLLAEADTKTEVTANMVRLAAGLKCSTKAVSRAFWKRGIYFRPLYEKPELTDEDRMDRRCFTDEHKDKTDKKWQKFPHCIVDNKNFPVYTKGKDRDYAARRRVRGAYRPRRRIFTHRTKPSRNLKRNTGTKSVIVTCAIGHGRVLMWHYVKGRWDAAAAEHMYKGPLLRSLKKNFPSAKSYRILEDNDPTGYKSRRGEQAKKDANIVPIPLPPRSPDFNPLDYSLWADLNRRMRAQEKAWPKIKRETRKQYLARLKRTAMNLPTEYINKIIGNMAVRCDACRKAKGGHFAEGGR